MNSPGTVASNLFYLPEADEKIDINFYSFLLRACRAAFNGSNGLASRDTAAGSSKSQTASLEREKNNEYIF